MGGLFSTVRDVATWLSWLMDAFPARDGDDDPILSRSTRREMQQVHRPYVPTTTVAEAGGYGFGLNVFTSSAFGTVVSHSGGLPGFGSHMRWHPETRTGVVALGNSRYARMGELTREAIELIIPSRQAVAGQPPPPALWPETVEAQRMVIALAERWDDAIARVLFADNVDLDEPIVRRAAAIDGLRVAHGSLRLEPSTPIISDSPAHLAWWMTGERGRVQFEITMTPERPPRVQWLDVISEP